MRQLRAEHTEQTRLGDGLVLEYGAEYLMNGVESMRAALRPHGRVIVRVAPQWMAAFSVDTEPGRVAAAGSDASGTNATATTRGKLTPAQEAWRAAEKAARS